MRVFVVTLMLLIFLAPAGAQPRYSCSQYHSQCVKINAPYGKSPVARCARYSSHCLTTGVWTAPEYPASGLIRR